jgi:hypothetical protein
MIPEHCHSEHREESSRMDVGAHAAGSFTAFRMTGVVDFISITESIAGSSYHD